jgi:RNA polymerase sigma-70 factor, ECF subfamily
MNMQSVDVMEVSSEGLRTNNPTATLQRRECVSSNRAEGRFADKFHGFPCKREDEALFFDNGHPLNALYERYRRPIHSHVLRILNSQEDANDVTQEVFVRVFTTWDRLYDRENLSAWLYRLATNLSIDLLRRRKRLSCWPLNRCQASDQQNESGVEDSASYLPHNSGGIPEIFEREHIRLALASMPKEYAIVLILRVAQGVSYQEVGAIVGISPTAAAARISRAKKLFREHYQRLDQAL